MKKIKIPRELAYIFGLVLVALGAMLMEKGNYGVSMLNAPSYVLYRFLSPMYSFVTFGMMEYTVQAVILILMCIVLKRFRISYLFAFITSVIFGFILDGFMLIGNSLPITVFTKHIYFIFGCLSCSAGVAFMFETYITPEVHELFVKEISSSFKLNITKVKLTYDITLCVLGLILSFILFGLWNFIGVKLGTILCSIVNGPTVSLFTNIYKKFFTFEDSLPLRSFFMKEQNTSKKGNE